MMKVNKKVEMFYFLFIIKRKTDCNKTSDSIKKFDVNISTSIYSSYIPCYFSQKYRYKQKSSCAAVSFMRKKI